MRVSGVSRRPVPRRATAPPAGAEEAGPTGWRWLIPGLVALVVAVYAAGVSGPFILDDQSAIVQNADIRDLSRLGRVLWPADDSSVAGRPLASLSFALGYAAGGLDPRGYHVVNIGLHALCAVLLFLVVRRTLRLASVRPALAWPPDRVAAAAAAIWAVHPLNSEVVSYLTQRTESLMAACLLATVYAAQRAAASGRPGWAVAATVACAAGMASKETMVVAPVLVALYDRAFLFGGWREAVRRRRGLYLGLAATWGLLALLVAGGPRAAVSGAASGVTVGTYLLNQAPLVLRYLRLAFWPSDLVVFYGWPRPLAFGDVAGDVVAVSVLLALTAALWAKAPRWGFLGAWVALALAPTSTLVPIATEVGAERRMYVPLAGLVTLAVVGTAVGAARAAWPAVRRPAPAAGVLAAVLTVFGTATAVRAAEYRVPVELYRTLVARWPTPVAFHILGEALVVEQRDAEAIAPLRRAVAMGDSRAGYPLGVALLNQRQIGEAREALAAFVASAGQAQSQPWLVPPQLDVLRARVLLATAAADAGQWAEAAAQAGVVVTRAPRHAEAWRLLALARFNLQQWPEAVDAYRAYLPLNPTDAQAVMNMGVAHAGSGDLPEALRLFERAVAMDPSNPNARRLRDLARQDLAAGR